MLHERFAPDGGGGGEYVALERCKGLIAAGCEVEVICAGRAGPDRVDGVPVRRLPLPRQLAGLMAPVAISAARRADVIHAFTYYAAPAARLVARLTGRPVICEQLALFGPVWREMSPGPVGRFRMAMERRQLRMGFDVHLFLSGHSMALAERLGFVGDGRVVAPGIDLDAFRDGPKADPPVVLFAGKFDTRKGLDRLHALAEALPDVQFEAVGWRGDMAPRRDLANLRITEGRDACYRAALARASILFMPSRAETFGLVIPEAMRAGCSIVSTIPGDYAGVCLSDYSLTGAVDAVCERLRSVSQMRREGAHNRQQSQAYDWKRSTDAVLDIYRGVLGTAGDVECRPKT